MAGLLIFLLLKFEKPLTTQYNLRGTHCDYFCGFSLLLFKNQPNDAREPDEGRVLPSLPRFQPPGNRGEEDRLVT